MRHKNFYLFLFAALFLICTPLRLMAAEKPMLMDGKKSLYQRVLTTPHAQLVPALGDPDEKEIATFSVYYIYEKQDYEGAPWLKVGTSTNGDIAGWVKEELTVPWKQQIVLAFSNPAGRERNLLFSSKQMLSDIWKHENPETIVAPLREKTIKEERPEGVISIEPENYVNFQAIDNFYLLPILDFERNIIGDTPINLLEIASVTDKTDEDEEDEQSTTETRQIKAFKAAVVFVIDTTISMGPYIDKTQDLVKEVYDSIGESDIADQIAFGLVAYRSNIEKVPALEYTSKLYVDPNDVTSGDDFLKRVKDIKPASVSTPSFNEDAYAGVMTAIQDIDWKDFGGRYIVLVTDAGALEGNDPLSATQLSSERIRQEASEKTIALYTMHLKTEAGKKNHYSAQAQYEDVTSNPYTDPLYYSIKTGNVDEYGAIVESLANALTDQIDLAFEGEDTAGSARTGTEQEEPSEPKSNAEKIKHDSFLIGKAMRLAYLGRVENTKAPSFFKAWMSDSDFSDPQRTIIDYRVLLTRKQLNDLTLILSELLTEFEKAQMSGERMSFSDFFDSLRSISAKMGQDPSQLSDSKLMRLGEAGLFDEYLEDLPRTSAFMDLSFEKWEQMAETQQERILDDIKSKLRHYRIVNEDSDRWVILTEGAPASEAVYPIPLDFMP